MKFIQGADRDVLETKSGGGCLMLFGLPFFAAGLAVMGASLGLWMQKGNPPPWYFGVPFGGIFASVGAAFIFGRGGIRIDRRNRTVTQWFGLLVPMKRTEYALDRFQCVKITKELRRSKNSSYTVYPVKLASDEEKDISFEEPREYREARSGAEEVAKFLGMNMVDCTAGEPVTRAPGELDESLRDRARRTGATVEMPDPPPDTRIRTVIEGNQLTLELPQKRFGAGDIGTMVIAVIIPSIVLFAFVLPFIKDLDLHESPGSRYILPIACGVALLPVLLVALSILTRHKRSNTVVASPEGLELRKSGLFGAKSQFIPSDELEELVLPSLKGGLDPVQAIRDSEMPQVVKGALTTLAKSSAARRANENGGIIARSDAAIIQFGETLSRAELQWIHAVIMKMMTV